MQNESRRVICAFYSVSSIGLQQIAGVYRHVAQGHLWDVTYLRHWDFADPARLAAELDAGADGIITSVPVRDTKLEERLRQSRIPTVFVDFDKNDRLPDCSPVSASVATDEYKAGVEAARHLLQQGKTLSYAFIPGENRQRRWSRLREEGFAAELAKNGQKVLVFDRRCGDLATFVADLPKPAAIAAASDELALRVLTACHGLQIEVPGQVMLIGFDDDELVCENASPRLTSVRIDHESVGFAAAEPLERLMRSPGRTVRDALVPPRGVAVRESTWRTAPAANLIERALLFIRDRARLGITVEDVVRHAGVSRRLLYLRFEQQLGKSVLQAITDRRVELLKARLRSGKGSLETLALDCGFPTAGQARRVFKSATGLTLRAFRQASAPAARTRAGRETQSR